MIKCIFIITYYVYIYLLTFKKCYEMQLSEMKIFGMPYTP